MALFNNQIGGIFQVKTLFQKLWPLLYKRAELDLRLTKSYLSYRRKACGAPDRWSKYTTPNFLILASILGNILMQYSLPHPHVRLRPHSHSVWLRQVLLLWRKIGGWWIHQYFYMVRLWWGFRVPAVFSLELSTRPQILVHFLFFISLWGMCCP